MKVHELKTDHKVFIESWNDKKRFEIRKNDRDFQLGDELLLRETKYTGKEMSAGKPLIYTGLDLRVRVTYKLPPGSYGLNSNWTVLSTVLLEDKGKQDKLSKIQELAQRGDVEPEWAFDQIRGMF